MMLKDLGRYLKGLRAAKGIKTQKEVAEKLSNLGVKGSQSLIAKYELGEVADPDPQVLLALSTIYEVDYMELILHLVEDKYRPTPSLSADKGEAIYEARWRVLQSALTRFKGIGGISKPKAGARLEELQLRAKAKLIAEEELLDVDGLALWEQEVTPLEKFWVAALNYVDNDNKEMLRVGVQNIKRGVIYTYFVPQDELKPGRSFWRLKGYLAELVANKDIVNRLVQGVPMKPEDLEPLNMDYAIANPHSQAPIGFQCVRRNKIPVFAFRTPDTELLPIISYLRDLADRAHQTGASEHDPEAVCGDPKILPFPTTNKQMARRK